MVSWLTNIGARSVNRSWLAANYDYLAWLSLIARSYAPNAAG